MGNNMKIRAPFHNFNVFSIIKGQPLTSIREGYVMPNLYRLNLFYLITGDMTADQLLNYNKSLLSTYEAS